MCLGLHRMLMRWCWFYTNTPQVLYGRAGYLMGNVILQDRLSKAAASAQMAGGSSAAAAALVATELPSPKAAHQVAQAILNSGGQPAS